MLLGFLVVSAPLVAALSYESHYLTFSDEGRRTYLSELDHPAFRFTPAGQPFIGPDVPIHPFRRIHQSPTVFHVEGYPFRATVPFWYNPSYWYEGAHFRFDLRAELNLLALSGGVYEDLLLSSAALLVGLVVLALIRCPWRPPEGLLLLWSLAALAAFALVHVEPRLVAPFLSLSWLWGYRGFFGTASARAHLVILAVVLALLIPLLLPVPQMALRTAQDLATRQPPSVDWRVASALEQIGLRPDDQVASIGLPAEDTFLRLARLVLPTWVPFNEVDQFWALDPQGKLEVFLDIAATGAKAVIAEEVPPEDRADWQRLGDTSVYIHLLVPLPGARLSPLK
jgi:hypothetical protein